MVKSQFKVYTWQKNPKTVVLVYKMCILKMYLLWWFSSVWIPGTGIRSTFTDFCWLHSTFKSFFSETSSHFSSSTSRSASIAGSRRGFWLWLCTTTFQIYLANSHERMFFDHQAVRMCSACSPLNLFLIYSFQNSVNCINLWWAVGWPTS